MPNMIDSVHLTGDDTNVFNGRIGQRPPEWARYCRVQCVATNYDFVYSATLGGDELARSSAAHLHGTVDISGANWPAGRYIGKEITDRNRANFEVLVNANLTTGEAMIHLEYLDHKPRASE